MSVLDELAHGIETRRIGAIASRVQDVGHASAPPLSVFLDAGVVPRAERADNHNQLGSDLAKYQLVQPGDLVFNRLRTWQGGFGASRHRGIVSPAYIVARPVDADARYLDYVLHSAPYLAELTRISKWMPPSQFDVLWTDLRGVEVPWLRVEEQRRVADFLDDRVARIHQIITARQAQRRLVAQSTTSRLQELQDEWTQRYGETRLGRVLVGLEQGWSPQAESTEASLDEWGVMRAGCVNDGIFREHDNKRLPDGLEPQRQYELRPGDLLLSRASGSLDKIGSVAVVPLGVRRGLLLCDKIYRLQPASTWDARFIAPMLRTHKSREAIRLGVSGAEGMANNLPSGVIRGLTLPLVPEGQQASFALTLEKLENASRQAEQALVDSVSLAQEYKQSLITAAVTGEIDVATAGSGIRG